MKRLAAMQLCPLFCTRPRTAAATAASTSASARTRKASEPPSSSTDGLSAAPAAAPMARPAPSDPVSVTAATRSSAMMPATAPLPTRSVWNTPDGTPASAGGVFEGEGAAAHVRRVLEDDDVAERERGREDADELPVREIPRHDGEEHAERFEDDARAGVGVDAAVEARGRRAQQAWGVARVVAARAGAFFDLGDGLCEWLAHLVGGEAAHRARAAVEDAGEAPQRGHALGDGRRGPERRGIGGAPEGGVDVGGGVLGVVGEFSAGGGVDRVEHRARGVSRCRCDAWAAR